MEDSLNTSNGYYDQVETVCQEFSVAPEHDSGYITNNQESNSENSMENCSGTQLSSSSCTTNIYISEDALLEKPTIECNKKLSSESDYSHLFYMGSHHTNEQDESYGSIVEASVSTAQSSLSGLDNTNDHSMGNISTTISVVNPICFQSSDDKTYNEILMEDQRPVAETLSIKTPVKCSTKLVNPNISPELFSEGEDQEKHEKVSEVLDTSQVQFNNSLTIRDGQSNVFKYDKRLLRNLQKSMAGFSPPSSFTNLQISVEDILVKIEANEQYFITSDYIENSKNDSKSSIGSSSSDIHSLLAPSTEHDVKSSSWPKVLDLRYHGLMYNQGKLSEDLEELYCKYSLRYVKAETTSTCSIVSSAKVSPSKRRSQLRWNGGKSPGKRFSHLARRRITFSSFGLQSTARQILDCRKPNFHMSKGKSPRKGTPKKSPRKSPRKKIRTPSSSSKKCGSCGKCFHGAYPDVAISASRVSTTKRALFQSPERDQRPCTSTGVCRKSPRRALFSSPSKTGSVGSAKASRDALFPSPAKSEFGSSGGGAGAKRPSPVKKFLLTASTSRCIAVKRKRSESSSDDWHQPSKLTKSMSFHVQSSTTDADNRIALMRRCNSDAEIGTTAALPGELTDSHKQKLLWAVSESLRTQKISRSHPKFKIFASTLARVIRRFLPDLSGRNCPRVPGSTSQRMLKIARQYVYQVIKGKTVDEIVENVINASSSKGTGAGTGTVLTNVQDSSFVNVKDKENVNTLNDNNHDKDKLRIKRNINFEERHHLDVNR